jgi:hypothetical protein
MPKTPTLKEQALARIWELAQQNDWGNAERVMDAYTADVKSGRDERHAAERAKS